MVYSLVNALHVNGERVVSLEVLNGDDIGKIEVEDSTPDGGLYFGHGRALVSGRRVKTEHIPKKMRVDVGSVIPDYGSSYNLKFVSERFKSIRFKSIVESIEPGVHQFIPFQIVGPHKAVLADMWFMVVCNRLDSVDREHTTLLLAHGVHWMPGREVPREQWPPRFDPNVKGKLVFNLAQIGDHHLWYDKHSGHGPFLSDKLAEALMAAAVIGANFTQREAV